MNNLHKAYYSLVVFAFLASCQSAPNTPSAANNRFAATIKETPLDYAELEAIYMEGVDINLPNADGETYLFRAVAVNNGHLVKWLLEHGAKVRHPNHDITMLSLMAHPPTRALLDNARDQASPPRFDPPGGKVIKLERNFVDAEAALFSGIEYANLDFLEQGIAGGADLNAKDLTYNLTPLELVRHLKREFEVLDLDTSNFEPIEQRLIEAISNQTVHREEEMIPAVVEEGVPSRDKPLPDGPKLAQIYRVGDVGVSPPVFKEKITPDYPEKAVASGVKGHVILSAVFKKDGSIVDIRIIKDLGQDMGFGESAIEALQKWTFAPGKYNGTESDVEMMLRFKFDY